MLVQTMQISGMTCLACEKLITKRVNKINGVFESWANHQTGELTVQADRQLSPSEIATALINTPYQLINDN